MSDIRVRIAPSPTGVCHIGVARAALFNWVFARHHNGTMILRIEDTDVKRNIEGAVQTIIDGLGWLGIDFDEGPFYQSQHLDRYNEVIEQLTREDRAYIDHDPEKGACVRLRMPSGRLTYTDIILGESGWDMSLLEDLVIRKSDGFPTYNFAVVVDDHDMRISHVIRGMEHFSNVPKQMAVYQALSWEAPKWAHFPLLMGPDGKKLSKRRDYSRYHIYSSIEDFRKAGYLPQTLVNFLMLIGWSPGDDTEIMDVRDIIARFDLDRVVKTHSQMNGEKLLWMNGKYSRKHTPEQLLELLTPYMREAGYDPGKYDREWLLGVVRLFHDNLELLAGFPVKAKYFLDEEVHFVEKAVGKHLKKEGAKETLTAVRDALASLDGFSDESVEKVLRDIAAERGVGFGKVAQPLRVAITGGDVSPGIHETVVRMGKDRVLKRINTALEKFGDCH